MMFRFHFFLSIAAYTFSGSILRLTMPVASSDFITGNRATPCEFPHLVALMYGRSHICNGAVIAHDWVLTSAKCVAYRLVIALSVVLDVHDYTSSGGYNRVKIEQKIIHTNFTNGPVAAQNDVALLRLRPNDFNISEKIIKIASHNYKTYEGQICTTCGLGNNGKDTILQMAYVSVLSKEQCTYYLTTAYSFDENICAQAYSTTEGCIQCIAGAGTPLVCGDELVGVKSSGIDYCQNTYFLTYPRGYTRVTSYKDWINSNCHNCSV